MGIISLALTALAPWLPAVAAIKRAGMIVVALVVVAGGAWGVWHIRVEAAASAIAERRSLRAENAALKDAAARANASETVGVDAAKEWAGKLAASEAARVELETMLTAKMAATVCFPSSMVEALNR
jgi:hypothetical protein